MPVQCLWEKGSRNGFFVRRSGRQQENIIVGVLQHLEITSDDDIEILERIGKSCFEVYRAKYKGQYVAAKKMGEFEKRFGNWA